MTKFNKKTIAFMFALLILCSSLISCVEISDVKDIVLDTNYSNNTIDTNEPINTNNNKNDNVNNSPAPTISDVKCFEWQGVSVTAKSIVDDSIWGTGIKFYIENNSAKDYTIGARAVIVNNCMTDALFSSAIAAGKKANDTMYFLSDELEHAGIEIIGQIEIYFYIYDTATYKTVYESECVTIRTSQYEDMDTVSNNEGALLYNKNGIKIVGKYVNEDTFWGSAVLLYVENTTSKNITVSCDDMSINGFMVNGIFVEEVYSGKYTFGDITIFSTDLEENDITAIDTIELKFNIYESDTYKTIDKTDAISFRAQ